MAKELTKSEMRRISVQNPMTLVEVVTKTRDERDRARAWAQRWKRVSHINRELLADHRDPEYTQKVVADGMRTLFQKAQVTVELDQTRAVLQKLVDSLDKETLCPCYSSQFLVSFSEEKSTVLCARCQARDFLEKTKASPAN